MEFPPPQPAEPSISTSTTPAFESRRDPNLHPDPDLDEALQKVLMTSGSDLHITVDAPPMIRVDGRARFLNDAVVGPDGAKVVDARKRNALRTALLAVIAESETDGPPARNHLQRARASVAR